MTKARTLADNFAADINGITAGTGITGGGTSGTVTVTNSMATAIDAKGDLVVGTGADTFSRLAVASTAGYLLSVDSAEATGLKWAAPAGAGGLTKIHSSTFSAVSSKSVTDCFSSTYENYKVIFIVNTGSNSASMKLRFSSSGTDNSSALYYTGSGGSRADGSNAPISSGPTATSADVARIEANSTQFQMVCFDVINPELAKRTSFTMVGAIQDSTSPLGMGGGGGFDGNTQFQGITFFPTAGTMTGSIAIYGYEK